MEDFSVDYDEVAVDHILDIHKCLMRANDTLQNAQAHKKLFFTGLAFVPTLTNVNLLSCISMNNQECKVRPKIVNVKSDEPVFFPFSIKIACA